MPEADGTPPVLLLHGQPGSGRDWHAVTAALGGGTRTIAPDRPGWNGAPATDLPGNAAAMVALLDRLHIKEAVVAGHSLGAAIACWMAFTYPERVSGLVLASPAANAACLEPIDHLMAAPVAGPLFSAALMAGTGLTLSTPLLRRLVAGLYQVDAAYLAAAGSDLRHPAAWRSYVVEQRALLAALPALERGLGRIAVPTAVLAGSADRIVPLAAARLLSEQVPGAELTVIQGADHLLPQRQGLRLAEAVLGVLSAA